jgi:cell division protein ZapA (FtsZ GTPase activity inhibitor)
LRSVKIKIFNREYNIKTDADVEYINRIAFHIEEKIKEHTSQVIDINIPFPLLLAVFKITDDFFRTDKELEEFKNRAEVRSKKLVEILDDALKNKKSFNTESDGSTKNPSLIQQEELFK